MFPTLESKVQKMKTVGFCKRIQGKAKKWGLLPGKSIFFSTDIREAVKNYLADLVR